MNDSSYLTWGLTLRWKSDGWCLDYTIIQPEASNDEHTILDKAEALHSLQYHLHSDLKSEYINEDDLMVLLQSLKDRFKRTEVNMTGSSYILDIVRL